MKGTVAEPDLTPQRSSSALVVVPAFLPLLLADATLPLVLCAGGAVVVLGLVVGWLIFGHGPRRGRAFARAERLLEEGDWEAARQLVLDLQSQGGHSQGWQERLRQLDSECLRRAAEQSLRDKQFDESLAYYRQAAQLLGEPEEKGRELVLNGMLGEVRRLFSSESNTQAIHSLLTQALTLQPGCAEAFFWRGLCEVREGRTEDAVQTLETAHRHSNKQFLDPPLYLGILLARQGRPQDSLRLLAEANRVDAGCPFVGLQMGLSLVAGGGDSSMALRVLQKAMGTRGLSLWQGTPQRAWIEAFPQSASYVRRLSEKHAYTCPLLGNDLTLLMRQGQQAMAQAYYRLGNYQEAADLYSRLLQDAPPTLPVLRGLGLALTRLEKYDQAYRHLRAAVELDPADALTTGYLALCGARGKPTNPEDRPRNVLWAIKQLARFDLLGNQEWAGLCAAIHAEAWALQLPLSREDQLRLCEVLASIKAHDPQAATAYDHLARTYPEALAVEHAWLYAQAATVHQARGECDLLLFARAFQDRPALEAYFARQGWNSEDAEYTCLERYAAASASGFPEVLGSDYPVRGVELLLQRSTRQEKAGDLNGAMSSVQVLLQLAPANLQGHDRKACLHARQGQLAQAVEVLQHWERLAPADVTPLLRRAVLEVQRGQRSLGLQALDHALALNQGQSQAALALLGARLALAIPEGTEPNPDAARARHYLELCLQEQPTHETARWMLAALQCVQGDLSGLAAQAGVMERPAVPDPRFHYLAAIAHFAAGQYTTAIETTKRCKGDRELGAEAHYLEGLAALRLQQEEQAREALTVVATSTAPSALHARALLGRMSFLTGQYSDASHWWNEVDPSRRSAWQLDEPLRQTVYLAGLQALDQGEYELAAERFREAGKLGLRERRLGQLIVLALFKAGQRKLYSADAARRGSFTPDA